MTQGNAMYLICEPCNKANEQDFGFKFAKRDVIGGYSPFGPGKATQQLTEWLKKHRHCGGKGHPDHFSLGLLIPRDSDQPKPRLIDTALKAVN